MNYRRFFSQIKKSLAYLRLKFRENGEDEGSAWLADNLYLLEGEGKRVCLSRRGLRRLPKGGARVIAAAQALAEKTATEVISDLTVAELDSLEVCFIGALVLSAAAAVEQKDVRRLADCITRLRETDSADFKELITEHCLVARELIKEKESRYFELDGESRATLRRRVAEGAKRARLSEKDYISKIKSEGGLLCEIPKRKNIGIIFLRTAFLIAAPILLTAASLALTRSLWLSLLLYLPFFALLLPVADAFTLHFTPPDRLLSLDPEKGIPEKGETAAVISCLLSDTDAVREALARLKRFCSVNPDKRLIFGLLADLPDADGAVDPGDRSIIKAAVNGIKDLGEDKFFLFLRGREYSETQRRYSGRERKRGAICDIVKFIGGEEIKGLLFRGNREKLSKCRFLLTLDFDTDLTIGSAAALVNKAMHPENLPAVKDGRVVKGHGIFAPRIVTGLAAFDQTAFSRIMSGSGGASSYSGAVGDLYQDLFDSGLFSGKGLINIEAAAQILPDSLPQNRILSHDIPEGCLLNAAYISDVELCDGCPASVSGYLKRLHRWTRGDLQNLPLVFDSRFDLLSKIKLSDNIRRAVTPIISLLLLLISSIKPNLLVICVALLSGFAGELYTVLSHGVKRLFTLRPHFGKSPIAAAAKRAAVEILLIPEKGIVILDAVIRALFRMAVTKRGLLDWSTAAQSDSFSKCGIKNAVFGALLLMLSAVFDSHSLLLTALSLLWLASPLLISRLNRRVSKKSASLSEKNREALYGYAASTWRFFEDTLTKKRGMLPPDNLQLEPVESVAERTSPTNIGLSMVAVLAARDLDFITAAELYGILEGSVSTCEGLEKHKGNLYNWYSLEDFSVLEPRYLSSVDSGNFLCCLIALKEGIREYFCEEERLRGLFDRIEALIAATDLSIFADLKRYRLVTGLNGALRQSSSAYDLLMSEALLTVYCATAQSKLPKKIFSSLSRVCAKEKGLFGALSWTGTVFEYFMPCLFLPVYPDSLIHASLLFALKCQKERVKGRGLPWGISESGYYGFDGLLQYQYRAHGVQKTALCRGQDTDLVISPYSSFLTLCIAPDGAMKNLSELKKRGLYYKYGFCEALDCTYSRTGGSEKRVVSFMSHHMGMSLIAAANALKDNIFVKRFMSDSAMSAATELLQEKLPDSSPLYSGYDEKREQKPSRYRQPSAELEEISPLSPRCTLFEGDGLTLTLSDSGGASLFSNGTDILAHSRDLITDPKGVFCFVAGKNKAFSVTAAPDYDATVRRKVVFSGGEAVFTAQCDGLEASLSFGLACKTAGGFVKLTVKNTQNRRKKTEALLYFEPMLCKRGDAAAHRAFAKLFLSCKTREGEAVFSRRGGRGARPLSLAVCRDFSEEIGCSLDRERLLTPPFGVKSLKDAFNRDFSRKSGEYFYPDLCGCVKIPVSLPPFAQKAFTFYFGVDESEEGARQRAQGLMKIGSKGIASSAARTSGIKIEAAGLDEMSRALENRILPCLLYPVAPSPEVKRAREKTEFFGDNALWSFGISGDNPIIAREIGKGDDREIIKSLVSIHRHLLQLGIKNDLVFICRDRHEYLRPVTSAVKALIKNFDSGIFVLDVTDREGEAEFIKARAAFLTPRVLLSALPRATDFGYKKLHPVFPDTDKNGFIKGGYVINPDKTSHTRPWCHVLANSVFGTLVSSRSIGHTYAVSSNANRLSSWSNDVTRDLDGEGLYLDIGEKRYSLTQNAAAVFYADRAEYLFKTSSFRGKITVSADKRRPVKKVSLKMEFSGPQDAEIIFFVIPEENSRIKYTKKSNVLYFQNLKNPLFKGSAFLYSDGECELITDRAELYSGKSIDSGYDCGAVKRRFEGVRELSADFYLGYSGRETALPRGTDCNEDVKDKIEFSLENTARQELLNTFLPCQISVCRIRARTAFYQSSGARGFRDQLQDACSEVIYSPSSAREQIIRAACRQFEEGDVLHWWNDRGALPPEGSRTKCSDDLIWLPYSVLRYIEVTGDRGLLDVKTPFIGSEVPKEKSEIFVTCRYTGKKETVYGHCILALNRAYNIGERGLVLMGSCDWNDGLSKVGVQGRGASVWCTMFLALVCRRFAELCRKRGDFESRDLLIARADSLDGAWKKQFEVDRYLRAYTDGGEKMGSRENERMKIDILPQSFAAIMYPEEEKSKIATDTAMKLLVDSENGIIKLFTPAFDGERVTATAPSDSEKYGYIAAYPPGVRENGGQYTHGALWFLFALIRQNRVEEAWRLADMLSPYENHLKKGNAYSGEPYYMAADVSDCEGRRGEAGWTLYTGAAGWYYRLLVEELYGIRRRGDRIYVSPKLPQKEKGFFVRLELRGDCEIELTVKRTGRDGLRVNGEKTDFIPVKSGVFKAEKEII